MAWDQLELGMTAIFAYLKPGGMVIPRQGPPCSTLSSLSIALLFFDFFLATSRALPVCRAYPPGMDGVLVAFKGDTAAVVAGGHDLRDGDRIIAAHHSGLKKTFPPSVHCGQRLRKGGSKGVVE